MTRRLLAVLGRDVSASLSPRLHGAAAAALGLDVAYVPVSCPDRADFERAVGALETLGALGANVTIPHKRAALELAQSVSTTAQEIGAVNTLTFASDGRRQGDNTDGPGLVRALQDLPPRAFERVQILGAGGAARAAAWALGRLGAREVVVTARRGAESVAELVGGRASTLERVQGATLVVSTLPGDVDVAERAVREWVDVSARPVVHDLAYGRTDPETGAYTESPLVLMAKLRELRAVDGRTMLVEQAALSLSLWTGGEVARIRQAMFAAVER